MKVAHISTWQIPCGIADYTAGLVDGLTAAAVASEVLPIRKPDNAYLTFKELCWEFQRLADSVPDDADVIHVQNEFSFFAGAYPTHYSSVAFGRFMSRLRRHRKPIIVTFHSLPSFLRPPLTGWRMRWHYFNLKRGWRANVTSHFHPSRRTLAVLHSRQTRRMYVDSGIKSSAIRVILQHTPPPVTQHPGPDEIAARKAALGFRPDSRVLSMFGFVSRYKGYEIAIESLRLLPPEYVLVIVGGPHPDGREMTMDNLVKFVLRHELQDRVRITGFVEPSVIREYQAIADINLAPYMGDTSLSSSAALTWALASGKPTIASKIDAFRELHGISPCVLLCTPDAPAELAFQIDRLSLDANLRRSLVHHAREYCGLTARDQIARQHLALYQDALSGLPAAGRLQHNAPALPIPA